MRRKVVRKPVTSLALFPFLAVLICTMGALIVLLVLVVQQARVQASARRQPAEAEDSAASQWQRKLREARSDHEWRREVLSEKRAEKTAEVTQTRNLLSHLEQNIRELEERWESLKTQAEELERVMQAQGGDRAAARQQLELLERELARAKRELDEARQQAAGRPPAFAIIPYEGPQGTRRRPIYLECTADAVILQPEGVRLEAKDFSGPIGPGNPLDAALRAVREYWARLETAGEHRDAYPLLIVRSSGVMAYSKARSAMQTWDDEFGYEMVNDEMALQFPPPDPRLAEVVSKAISDARRRQESLAAAMPKQYRTRGRGLVATSSGGFAPVDGFARDDGRTGGGRDGQGFDDRPGRGVPGGSGAGRSFGSDPSELGGTGFGTAPDGTPGGAPGGPGGPDDFAAPAHGDYSERMPALGPDGKGQAGDAFGSDPAARTGRDTQGESTSTSRGQESGHGGQEDQGAHDGTSTAMTPGPATPGIGTPGANGTGGASGMGSPSSLADARGDNWGLPNAAQGLVGVTRPLQVAVLPDRLVLLPNRNESWQPVIVPVEGPLRHSIDELVTHVWKRIKGWGIAVPGGYWKPVLVVEVLPGGEPRFRELQALLQDSGLEVQRKGN